MYFRVRNSLKFRGYLNFDNFSNKTIVVSDNCFLFSIFSFVYSNRVSFRKQMNFELIFPTTPFIRTYHFLLDLRAQYEIYESIEIIISWNFFLEINFTAQYKQIPYCKVVSCNNRIKYKQTCLLPLTLLSLCPCNLKSKLFRSERKFLVTIKRNILEYVSAKITKLNLSLNKYKRVG